MEIYCPACFKYFEGVGGVHQICSFCKVGFSIKTRIKDYEWTEEKPHIAQDRAEEDQGVSDI